MRNAGRRNSMSQLEAENLTQGSLSMAKRRAAPGKKTRESASAADPANQVAEQAATEESQAHRKPLAARPPKKHVVLVVVFGSLLLGWLGFLAFAAFAGR